MPASGVGKALMIASVLLVLIVELLNSAVEAAVDRISLENHQLAKRAKDIGSAAVFVSLVNVASSGAWSVRLTAISRRVRAIACLPRARAVTKSSTNLNEGFHGPPAGCAGMNDTAVAVKQLQPVGVGRLRIAIVTETYPPEVNGVAMTIGRMSMACCARGHDVQLVRPRQHDADAPASSTGLRELLVRGCPAAALLRLAHGAARHAQLLRLWSERAAGHRARGHRRAARLVGARSRLADWASPSSSDFHTNFHSYSKHYGFGLAQARSSPAI